MFITIKEKNKKYRGFFQEVPVRELRKSQDLQACSITNDGVIGWIAMERHPKEMLWFRLPSGLNVIPRSAPGR